MAWESTALDLADKVGTGSTAPHPAIQNADDHLRNHGFLRSRRGWALSPAFDINPDPDPHKDRVTGIAGARSPEDELDALLMAAPEFGLSDRQAKGVLTEVFDATGGWRDTARGHRISDAEINVLEASFEGLRGEAADRAAG